MASASLPDNRIYEQASPSNKDGNVITLPTYFPPEFGIQLAAGDGNAVAYQTTGAVGNMSDQGGIQEVIARHVPGGGWATEPADPRQLGQLGLVASAEDPGFYATSSDFSDIFFDPTGCCVETKAAYSPEEPASGLDLKLYFSEGPFAFPVWVGKPTSENPIPSPDTEMPNWDVAGSMEGTFYFNYSGTLMPEDEAEFETANKEKVAGGRAIHLMTGTWGFYEWAKGRGLAEAGVLPDGQVSPWGAVSVADAQSYRGLTTSGDEKGVGAEAQNNQVSENGKRAFFLSPLAEFSSAPNAEAFKSCEEGQVNQERQEKEEHTKTGRPERHVKICTSEPPEVYMRETLPSGEHKVVLISHDESGEPAPRGVVPMESISQPRYGHNNTDAYASPDGSRVFFATEAGSPALAAGVSPGSEWWLYLDGFVRSGQFKLEVTTSAGEQTTAPIKFNASDAEVQSALEALSNIGPGKVTVEPTSNPCVEGPGNLCNHEWLIKFTINISTIALNETELPGGNYNFVRNITAPDVYEYDATTGALSYRPQLDGARFAASSSDGSHVMFVSSQGNLELFVNEPGAAPTVATIAKNINSSVSPARAAANGSAFLFYASSYKGGPLANFNNGGFSQLYRYDVASKRLECVSCPPAGVNATGNAELNQDYTPRTVQQVRLMSEDGSRVFFQSPDPLVGADVNGKPDVYEWENGHVYLISAGNAKVPSFYIDNSASGGDVFFATVQGLIPSDKDSLVDVYDARIPRPGDRIPPEQTPCSGAVCQGPPSVPQLLTPAASATFEGLGNIPPELVREKTETKPAVKCKKGFVKRNGKCVKHKKEKKGKKARSRRRARGGGK